MYIKFNLKMKQKKILLFSSQYNGGCFHYANEIMRNWGGDFEIALSAKTEEPHHLNPDWTFRYVGYGSIVRILSAIWTGLRILFSSLGGKYSCVIFFGIAPFDNLVQKLIRISNVPIFTVIHDGKMHAGEASDKYQRQMIDIMHRSTGLIFLSTYVRDLVKENFQIDKPSFIAPHGLIDCGSLPKEEPNQKPVLLFLGRISKYKGVELLVEAMKSVPADLYDKLIIAGKSNYNLEIDNLNGKVELYDKWLTNEDMARFISQCDIMLFPYLEASQSGVATLAINYAKPSIVTNVGAFKEQFDEESVIFTAPNSAELTKAIIYLLQNPSQLDIMKKAMLNLKAKYSWKTIADNLNEEICKFVT